MYTLGDLIMYTLRRVLDNVYIRGSDNVHITEGPR
jgi:hypothetical protein